MHNQAQVQWLIHWKDTAEKDATWEVAAEIEKAYPSFDPWGQGSS